MIRGVHRPAAGSSWFGVGAPTAAVAAVAGALVVHSPPLALVVVGLAVVATYLGETARRPLGEVLVVGMIGPERRRRHPPARRPPAPPPDRRSKPLSSCFWRLPVCLTGITVPAGAAGRALGCVALFVIWTLISFTWGSVVHPRACRTSSCTSRRCSSWRSRRRWSTIAGPQAHEIVGRAFWVAAIVGLGLYAISVAIAGPGTAKIISPRPFGLMGVVLVAWFVSGGLIGPRWAYWVVAFAIGPDPAVAVALGARGRVRARRAGAAQPAQLPRLARRHRRDRATLALALSAVFFYAPLHHRFFHGDTQKVGGFSINVTGRNALWSANWGWFKEKPRSAGAPARPTG